MRRFNILIIVMVLVSSMNVAVNAKGGPKNFCKGKGPFGMFGRRSFRSTEQKGINALHPTGQTRAGMEHGADAIYGIDKPRGPR